jgi:NhaP-type Na+/H+ or K+/H+ antiporter
LVVDWRGHWALVGFRAIRELTFRMYEVIVYQVILGAVMGVFIGIVARKSLRWAHDKQ